MSSAPVICFGQQPCGFFPRRFLVAKIWTARRLQREIGGEIVFFYHDSDHDPRETKTTVRHLKTGDPLLLNFGFKNKTQRKFSPLYFKEIQTGWRETALGQLQTYVAPKWVELFRSITSSNIADFCLDMYAGMGLLDGIKVVRSSDRAFRAQACDITDYFVDAPYEGEVVRARPDGDVFKLHEGGSSFITFPATPFTKEQLSPTRDSRLCWMQSVIRCTHYIAGAGEQAYLKQEEAPEISFVKREEIDRSDESYTDISN